MGHTMLQAVEKDQHQEKNPQYLYSSISIAVIARIFFLMRDSQSVIREL